MCGLPTCRTSRQDDLGEEPPQEDEGAVTMNTKPVYLTAEGLEKLKVLLEGEGPK